jgi:hypothetical protein
MLPPEDSFGNVELIRGQQVFIYLDLRLDLAYSRRDDDSVEHVPNIVPLFKIRD